MEAYTKNITQREGIINYSQDEIRIKLRSIPKVKQVEYYKVARSCLKRGVFELSFEVYI